MNPNMTVGKKPVANGAEAGGVIGESRDVRPAAAPEAPPAATRAVKIRPHWLGLLVGQLVLRVCSPEKAKEACIACRLKPFCQCAQDDRNAARAVETWFWVFSIVGTAVVILCCFL
jgi:hypothetical protein